MLYMRKIKYDNIKLKYLFVKINIFISSYILFMARKEDKNWTYSNFLDHKGVSQVLFSLLPTHRKLFMDILFF